MAQPGDAHDDVSISADLSEELLHRSLTSPLSDSSQGSGKGQVWAADASAPGGPAGAQLEETETHPKRQTDPHHFWRSFVASAPPTDITWNRHPLDLQELRPSQPEDGRFCAPHGPRYSSKESALPSIARHIHHIDHDPGLSTSVGADKWSGARSETSVAADVAQPQPLQQSQPRRLLSPGQSADRVVQSHGAELQITQGGMETPTPWNTSMAAEDYFSQPAHLPSSEPRGHQRPSPGEAEGPYRNASGAETPSSSDPEALQPPHRRAGQDLSLVQQYLDQLLYGHLAEQPWPPHDSTSTQPLYLPGRPTHNQSQEPEANHSPQTSPISPQASLSASPSPNPSPAREVSATGPAFGADYLPLPQVQSTPQPGLKHEVDSRGSVHSDTTASPNSPLHAKRPWLLPSPVRRSEPPPADSTARGFNMTDRPQAKPSVLPPPHHAQPRASTGNVSSSSAAQQRRAEVLPAGAEPLLGESPRHALDSVPYRPFGQPAEPILHAQRVSVAQAKLISLQHISKANKKATSSPGPPKTSAGEAVSSEPSSTASRAASGQLRRRAALQRLKIHKRTNSRRRISTALPAAPAQPIWTSQALRWEADTSLELGHMETSHDSADSSRTAPAASGASPPVDLLVEAEERLEDLQGLLSLAEARSPHARQSVTPAAPHLSPPCRPAVSSSHHTLPPSQASSERAAAELIGRLRALQDIVKEQIASADQHSRLVVSQETEPRGAPARTPKAQADTTSLQPQGVDWPLSPSGPAGSGEADPWRAIPTPHRLQQSRPLELQQSSGQPLLVLTASLAPATVRAESTWGPVVRASNISDSKGPATRDREPLSLAKGPSHACSVPSVGFETPRTASACRPQSDGAVVDLVDDSWLVRMLEGATPLCNSRDPNASAGVESAPGLVGRSQQRPTASSLHSSPSPQPPKEPINVVSPPSIWGSSDVAVPQEPTSRQQEVEMGPPVQAAPLSEAVEFSWKPLLWDLLGDMESTVAACTAGAFSPEQRPLLPPSSPVSHYAPSLGVAHEPARPEFLRPEVGPELLEWAEDEENDRFQRLLQLSERLGFTLPRHTEQHQQASNHGKGRSVSESSSGHSCRGTSSPSPSPSPSSTWSAGGGKESSASPGTAVGSSSAAVELGRLAAEADRLGSGLEAVRLNLEQLTTLGSGVQSQAGQHLPGSASSGSELAPLPLRRTDCSDGAAVVRTPSTVPRPYESSSLRRPSTSVSTAHSYQNPSPLNRQPATTDSASRSAVYGAANWATPGSGATTQGWRPAPPSSSSSTFGFRFVREVPGRTSLELGSEGETAGACATPRLWWGNKQHSGQKSPPQRSASSLPRHRGTSRRDVHQSGRSRENVSFVDDGIALDATGSELRKAMEALAIAEVTATALRERLLSQQGMLLRLVKGYAGLHLGGSDAVPAGWEAFEQSAAAVKSRVQSLRLDLGRVGHSEHRLVGTAAYHGLAHLVTECFHIERQASSLRSTCATAGRESGSLLERCSRALADCDASAAEIAQLQRREGLLAMDLASAGHEPNTDDSDSLCSRVARLVEMAIAVKEELEAAGAAATRSEAEATELTAKLAESDEHLAMLLARASGLEQQASCLTERDTVPTRSGVRFTEGAVQPQRQLRFTPLIPSQDSDPERHARPSGSAEARNVVTVGQHEGQQPQTISAVPTPHREVIEAARYSPPVSQSKADRENRARSEADEAIANPAHSAAGANEPHRGGMRGLGASASLAAALRRVQGSNCTPRRAQRLSETAARLQARLASPQHGQLLVASTSPSVRRQPQRQVNALRLRRSSSSSSSSSSSD